MVGREVEMVCDYGPLNKGQVYKVRQVGRDWYRLKNVFVPIRLTTTPRPEEVIRKRPVRDRGYQWDYERYDQMSA